jgi:hypothetical protein
MKIDDSVKIIGGKSKGCVGVITSLKKVFIMVRLTKDKKGEALFADSSKKVKRDYIEIIDPPAIEMPKEENLKYVDNVDDDSLNKDIFKTIDEQIASTQSPFVAQSQDKTVSFKEETEPLDKDENTFTIYPPNEHPKPLSYMVNENNVKEPAITIDDAINYRDENTKLIFKMDAMMMFQNKACEEISNLKFELKQLKEQLGDSVRLDKIEELKNIINSI